MLQQLETFNRNVNSIKHHNEQPGFVFLPDEFHDEKPSSESGLVIYQQGLITLNYFCTSEFNDTTTVP